MSNKKLSNEAQNPALRKTAVSGSLHQMRAINTFKEMEKQLEILKQDVSFREYIGFEMWGELSVQRGQSYTPISKIVKSDFFFN
jgi:hypothetical protein